MNHHCPQCDHVIPETQATAQLVTSSVQHFLDNKPEALRPTAACPHCGSTLIVNIHPSEWDWRKGKGLHRKAWLRGAPYFFMASVLMANLLGHSMVGIVLGVLCGASAIWLFATNQYETVTEYWPRYRLKPTSTDEGNP